MRSQKLQAVSVERFVLGLKDWRRNKTVGGAGNNTARSTGRFVSHCFP